MSRLYVANINHFGKAGGFAAMMERLDPDRPGDPPSLDEVSTFVGVFTTGWTLRCLVHSWGEGWVRQKQRWGPNYLCLDVFILRFSFRVEPNFLKALFRRHFLFFRSFFHLALGNFENTCLVFMFFGGFLRSFLTYNPNFRGSQVVKQLFVQFQMFQISF